MAFNKRIHLLLNRPFQLISDLRSTSAIFTRTDPRLYSPLVTMEFRGITLFFLLAKQLRRGFTGFTRILSAISPPSHPLAFPRAIFGFVRLF